MAFPVDATTSGGSSMATATALMLQNEMLGVWRSSGAPISAAAAAVNGTAAGLLGASTMHRRIFESMIAAVLIAMSSQLTNRLPPLIEFVVQHLSWLLALMLTSLAWLLRRLWRKDVPRRRLYRQVHNYTQSKRINTMFDPVMWFLTSRVDYQREPSVEFFQTKPLHEQTVAKPDDYEVSKSLPDKNQNQVEFRGHRITYHTDNTLITVYGDEERKRERRSVALECDVLETERADILEQFCQHCEWEFREHQSHTRWSQRVFVNQRGGSWSEKREHRNARRADTVALRDGVEKQVFEAVREFAASELRYARLGYPYTLNCLFYGPPGSGKTSTILAMSLEAKRDIYYLNLSEVASDAELGRLLDAIPSKSSVLVIEDVDAQTQVLRSRTGAPAAGGGSAAAPASAADPAAGVDALQQLMASAVAAASGAGASNRAMVAALMETAGAAAATPSASTLSLSGVLNHLDGVFSRHGLIMFFTANHPEKVDGAMWRDGRTHLKIEFRLCDRRQVERLYRIFCESDAPAGALEGFVDDAVSPSTVVQTLFMHGHDPAEAMRRIVRRSQSPNANDPFYQATESSGGGDRKEKAKTHAPAAPPPEAVRSYDAEAMDRNPAIQARRAALAAPVPDFVLKYPVVVKDGASLSEEDEGKKTG